MLLGYKKDRLQILFIISIIWFLFGAISFIMLLKDGEGNLVLPILYMAQAGLFYGIYKYCKVKKYIYISDEYIQRNSLSQSKVYLQDILKVRKRGKFYFFYTSKRTLRINTQLLDKNAVDTLDTFIDNLPNALTV